MPGKFDMTGVSSFAVYFGYLGSGWARCAADGGLGSGRPPCSGALLGHSCSAVLAS